MNRTIIIRYGEVSLKGANRGKFENKLKDNIRSYLIKKGIKFFGVRSTSGRIFVDEPSDIPDMSKVLGIVSYSPGYELGPDLEAVKDFLLQQEDLFKGVSTFRITASRSDKSFPLKSPEIEREVGAAVVQKFGLSVDLKNPQLNVGIEYVAGSFYVYTETYRGWGGLPVGVTGKLVALMSAGIDSPVAAFLMMKRGAKLVVLHFKKKAFVDRFSEIFSVLSEYAAGEEPELVVVDMGKMAEFFDTVQQDPRHHRYMCVLCKNIMLRTAEKLAKLKGAMGIVTGDSLGQVASQTLENLMVQRHGISLPVYSPLIGMDKMEVVDLARRIGTFSYSAEHKDHPCPLHRHPVTQADLSKFLKYRQEIFSKIKDPVSRLLR